jgi:NAD(P)-dependent dehydrogenase (short-subunit alcohol dehydrogenase family)
MSSLNSVRSFVSRFRKKEQQLDILINNAGVLLAEKGVSKEGYDLNFVTNILGPFLLTNLLIPVLKANAPSRIINVSSGGMYSQKLDVNDLQFKNKPFNGVKAYAQAKRAQVILTEIWSEKLADSGITVNAMHPGWVDTPGLRKSLPVFRRLMKKQLRTPQQGADTIVWLAVANSVENTSGRFWHDRQQRFTHLLPWTRSSYQDRKHLWNTCMHLSGLSNKAG